MPRPLLALLTTLALLAASPVAAGAAAQPAADPLRTLAGDSPLCRGVAIDAASRASCRATGAIEHAYPLDRYRFDWHIDTGLTKDPVDNLLAGIQWVLSMVWLALLWAMKGVLLGFQWAFSLDLLGDALTPIRVALLRLHEQTLGQPWLLAAISVLGLGGIWRGLVQRDSTAATGGLIAAVLMMSVALFVIAKPEATVGELSKGANAVALGFLAGAGEGTVREPTRTVASASRRLFDAVVLRPWCALNFGDVAWCLDRAPGDSMSRAERWLRFSPGSAQRDAEYEWLADPDAEPWKRGADVVGIDVPGGDVLAADDDEIRRQLEGYRVSDSDRERVALQRKDATPMRVALLALVALGLTGCLVLIGWLTVRILLAGLLTLMLLLAAPVVLLLPALGAGGREQFIGWAKRLLSAVIAKAIYALLLALVLTVNTVVTSLDGELPWLAAWLVACVFWWGVLLKRDELLAWISIGDPAHKQGTLQRAYYATRVARPLTRTARRAAATAALPATTAAAVGSVALRARRERDDVRTEAVQTVAREQLREQARARLDHRYTDMHERLAAHDDAKEKTVGLDRRIGTLDRQIDQAKTQHTRARTDTERTTALEQQKTLTTERGKLIAQKRALSPRLLPRIDEGVARKFVEAAERNEVEQGTRFTDRQLDLGLDELRADAHDRTPDPDDPQQAWRASSGTPAGEPLDARGRAAPQPPRSTRERIMRDLERDRALLGALPQDESRPSRRHRRTAVTRLDRKTVRTEIKRVRHERREDR